jgi:hypothetical protein
MAPKTNIKCSLPVSKKMEIIVKVDAQPHVTQSKVVEQLGVPVLTLNNGKQEKYIQ